MLDAGRTPQRDNHNTHKLNKADHPHCSNHLLQKSQELKMSFPGLAQKMHESAEYRRIGVPPHRLSPLKNDWLKIYSPLVDQLKLQVRFNTKVKCVELKTSDQTEEDSIIQKGADFVKAFCLGFQIEDALALLRLDDIYIDSFEIKDVKSLSGDHLSRAIGRLAGKGGRTKSTIENSSKTRIVVADSKIHILGSYRNIRIAKDALVSLIMGSTPGRIYTKLRSVGARLAERI